MIYDDLNAQEFYEPSESPRIPARITAATWGDLRRELHWWLGTGPEPSMDGRQVPNGWRMNENDWDDASEIKLEENANLVTELCAYDHRSQSLCHARCVSSTCLRQSLRSPRRSGSKNSVYIIFSLLWRPIVFSRNISLESPQELQIPSSNKPAWRLHASGTQGLSPKIDGHDKDVNSGHSLFLTFGPNLVIETADRSWSSWKVL